MKNVFITLLLFISVGLFARTDSLSTLRIIIDGAKTDSGLIMVAMSESEESYQTRGEAYKAAALEVSKGQAEWVIESLPYGTYAIKVFHDINGNGQLDTKMFGIPSEPYGFSNNPKGNMGPASWKDARFEIKYPEEEIIIKLQ